MARRRRLKIRPVLITLNILVLFIIAIFYVFRAVKFYKAENGKKVSEGGEVVNLLSDAVLKRESLVDLTKGLIFNDSNNTYIYKGKVEDNYLEYSGMLYRIIGVDSEKNVRAVSEDILTIMYSGLEKGYYNSYVNKWLNKSDEDYSGIFENNLYGTELLTDSYLCNDKIDDVTKLSCDEYKSDSLITLLSLDDYANAGGKESFLNTGDNFYLATNNSEGKNYYITNEGDVGINELTTKTYGVRAVISISNSTELLEGNGKKNNPYVIEKHDIKTLKDVYVGSYVKFSDNIFRVVDVTDDKVKLALNGVIMENEEPFTIKFSNSSNKYSNNKNTVGSYLNNDYFETLSNSDSIIESKWYIGQLSLDDLDYSAYYDNSVSMKIGMLTLGDMYIQDVNNVFTISRAMEDDNIINVINENGIVFGDFTTSKYSVRPSFYIDSSIEIESGSGSIDDVYVLGVSDEEEKEE